MEVPAYCFFILLTLSVVFLQNTDAQDCDITDQLDNCKAIAKNRYFCYTIEDLCCQTCKNNTSGIPGCPYGDQRRDCNPDNCTTADVNYLTTCCETCSNISSTTTTQTSPVTGTTSQTSSVTATSIQTTTTPSTELGYCLVPDATYFRVSCGTIEKWLPNVCSIDFLRQSCCEVCKLTTTDVTMTTIPSNTTIGQQNTTLCLNPSGTYYAVSCSSIQWEPMLCDDAIFSFHCCQNCTVTTTASPVTVTPPSRKMCLRRSAQYSNTLCGYLRRKTRLNTYDFCSIPYLDSRCCRPCPNATGKAECQDTSRSCPVLSRIVPEIICNFNSDVCCDSCKNYKMSTRRQELLSILRRVGRMKSMSVIRGMSRIKPKRRYNRRRVYDD